MVDVDSQPAAVAIMSIVKLRERHGDLTREYGTFPDKPPREFLDKVAAFQAAASAAGSGISSIDERLEVQSRINFWQSARINAGQRPNTVLLVPFDREAAKRAAGNKAPYKGLAAFQTDDAKNFSGRYEVVGKLIKDVLSHRLLAVIGLSGSGKSSVVRAGLIPQLAEGAYDGVDDGDLTASNGWKYPQPILPGTDPLAALETVYGAITAPEALPAALDRLGAPVLLSIDQFEEVFTLSEPSERRNLFIDALYAATTSAGHRHMVVITMRSDYIERIQAHPEFAKAFEAGLTIIQSMQASDLRKAIVEPAARLGVGFEDGLVDKLQASVQGAEAGLPLLSFTLLKLWEARADGPMKVADYDRLGGNPSVILSKSADEVFDRMGDGQRNVKEIFTRLVRMNKTLDATSNRIKRKELDVLGAAVTVDPVLAELARENLIRMSPADKITPATSIEVGHEALIRNWEKLTGWVRDSLNSDTSRRAFAVNADTWSKRANDKDRKSDLLAGLALKQAAAFAELTDTEKAFIAASQKHEAWRQRKFWAVTIMIAGLAIAASILSLRLIQIDRAKEAAKRADAMYATAEALVDRGDVLLAKKVLLDSVSPDAELPPRVQALLQAADLNALDEERLEVPELKALHAEALAKLRRAEATPPKSLADRMERKMLRSMANITGQPLDVSISDDGATLLSLWSDGKARVWFRSDDAKGWQGPLLLAIPGRAIYKIVVSPNGQQAFSASRLDDAGLEAARAGQTPDPVFTMSEIWTLDPAMAESKLVRARPYDYINDIAFRADGEQVILAKEIGFAIVDAANGAVKYESHSPWAFNEASWSSKGDRILSVFPDGSIEIVDAETHGLESSIVVGKDKPSATAARFSPNGASLAVGSKDGMVRIFQTDAKAQNGQHDFYELAGHRKSVTGVAFSPDGGTLVSSSEDGTLRLWELGINSGRLLRTVAPADRAGGAAAVNSLAFSTDGERIVAAVNDGSIRIYNVNGLKLDHEAAIGTPTEQYYSAAFMTSRNKAWLITNTDIAEGSKSARGVSTDSRAHYELFDLKTGAVRANWISANASQIYAPQLSDDGSQLVYIRSSADADDIVETRSMATPGNAIQIEQFDVFPELVDVSPDGKTIISVDAEGGILSFDTNGRRSATTFENAPFEDWVDASLLHAFAPSGPKLFVIASPDERMSFVYNHASGKILARIQSAGKVASLQFSPDGKRLFIGTDSGAGAIWDTATGMLLRRLNSQHDGSINFAAFSADGKRLLTGSTDATARLWNAETGDLLRVLRGHKATLSGGRFSPGGDRVLTESDDQTVMLWDTVTGKQLTVLRGPADAGALWGWFGADGKTVETVSQGRAVRRTWNVGAKPYRYEELRDEACKDGGIVSADARERNALAIASPIAKCAGFKAKK